jgi:hypothetical protein
MVNERGRLITSALAQRPTAGVTQDRDGPGAAPIVMGLALAALVVLALAWPRDDEPLGRLGAAAKNVAAIGGVLVAVWALYRRRSTP